MSAEIAITLHSSANIVLNRKGSIDRIRLLSHCLAGILNAVPSGTGDADAINEKLKTNLIGCVSVM